MGREKGILPDQGERGTHNVREGRGESISTDMREKKGGKEERCVLLFLIRKFQPKIFLVSNHGVSIYPKRGSSYKYSIKASIVKKIKCMIVVLEQMYV